MKLRLGEIKKQPSGYSAFIPNDFPPRDPWDFSKNLLLKHATAQRLVGKLDGVTQQLPDVDFFLSMYIRKDAASSSQIEGTQATMIHVIEAEAKTTESYPADVDDIRHYIKALNYGLERLEKLPLSLRFIRELHRKLLAGARATQFSDPGEFRKTQNWIGGTKPANAHFVPPPPDEMTRALCDFEKFLHDRGELLTLLKIGIAHAQFETIHPFLDGNGRTGRLLITVMLWLEGLLEKPVLFLSSYFKKHQSIYYDRLNGYRDGEVEAWLDFMLDGVIEIAGQAIETARRISEIRQEDIDKMGTLGKPAAESGVLVLRNLYSLPIVNVNVIKEWTGFTRKGALGVINRFVELEILEQKDKAATYGRSFIYRRYVDAFMDE